MSTRDIATDAEVRRRALDPAKSFLVEAPAGSGKTELLIQRYLRLLGVVSQPESIVALTFTRKAAAEMKERVLLALRAAAEDTPVKDEYARLTRQLATAALERSRELDWDIIQDSGRLQIGTIDSFCSLLTRQMPLLARFGSSPNIIEFAGELFHLAARRAIVALAETPDYQDVFHEITIHFDGNLSWVEGLIATLLGRRDQWVRRLQGKEDIDLREDINEVLADEIYKRIETAHGLWPVEIEKRPELSIAALDQWCSTAGALLTKEGEPRRRAEYCDELDRNPDFCKALHLCRLPVPRAVSDEQWRLISNFTALLAIAVEKLEEVFAERGEVDFTRISQAAVDALGTPDNPTELAYKLDFRIEHLLVDEFQDTSLVQYELLERLTAQWSFDDGRSLFLVGDPMQSIYRFRDAEVALFVRAAQKGMGTVPLETLRLTNNFRSTPAIVKWVTEVFERITPKVDDAEKGMVSLRETQAAKTERGPSPQIHRFVDDDGRGEATKVVKLAHESLKKNYTTAILVRTRNHLAAILPALRKEGIPYEAVDLDALTEEQHILDLISLTRAIHHVADRVAWIACLRAPFCGLTLADLALLLEGQPPNAVIERLGDAEKLSRLSPDGRSRASRFYEVLSAAVENFGRLPIREVVEAAWVALGGPAALSGENQWEDAESFLALLESSDEGGRVSDFSLFRERLEFLFARPRNHEATAVQIMTIHKAKGLQFDTVIVPQMQGTSRPPDRDLLVWATRLDQDGSERLLLAGLPQSGTKDSPDQVYYEFVRKQASDRDKAEEVRLFYVAATRAKKMLHMLGSVKSKTAGTGVCKPAGFLKMLWDEEEEHFNAEMRRQAMASAQGDLLLIPEVVTKLRRLPASWCFPTPEPGAQWRHSYDLETPSGRQPSYEWVSETGRRVGTVVHDVLRRIAEDGLERWNAMKIDQMRQYAENELRVAGVASDERPRAVDRVLKALKNVLASDRGRWILGSHAKAQCEWALGGMVGERLESARIDRTFVDADGVRWVIDYKTSSHEGGNRESFLEEEKRRYQAQLETYARLLQQAGEVRVALGLYFPLMDEWMAWEVPAQEPVFAAK